MSYKTLNGIETKWSTAFPPKESITEIFSLHETMNCLHYADYDNIDVAENLKSAIRYGGLNLHALQLDMVWPNPEDIYKARCSTSKKIEIILQVGKNALEQINNDPEEMVRRIISYGNNVNYILLDKSMGKGLGMDATALIPFVSAIKKYLPSLGVVVAGGLGPTSMHLLEPLTKIFKDLSIDAQGQLRPSKNALDPVNWEMAKTYLIKALKAL